MIPSSMKDGLLVPWTSQKAGNRQMRKEKKKIVSVIAFYYKLQPVQVTEDQSIIITEHAVLVFKAALIYNVTKERESEKV